VRSDEAIAIVGAGAVVPGAHDTEAFWANIRDRVDAVAPVAERRWIAGREAMTRQGPEVDTAYSDRCCLLPEPRFDPAGLRLDPETAAALDPMHQAVLAAAREAVGGRRPPLLDRERTGVVLAAIVLPTDGAAALTRELIGGLLEEHAAGAAPRPPDPRLRVAARVAGYPAALLARALGLGGGAFTLDAACASSLYAVKLACDALLAGRAEAMLAGGVSRPDCLFTQVGFSQLRALSPSGRCAPFDRRADGLVVGEGAGVVVLKRLADARRDGDHVQGIIRAVGLSNDLGGNLLAPETRGQLRAMRAAYAAAGWSPFEVDLIECHGAGTPVGDAVEIASLRELWGEDGWRPGGCPLGSVKSMIGHLLTAAGAAGLIKLLLALAHRTLPPSLNFTEPPEGSPLIGGPFRVQTECAPWEPRPGGVPRRAALSAFGFGGINAHLLLEEAPGEEQVHQRRCAWSAAACIEGGAGPAGGAARSAAPVCEAAVVGAAACIGRAATLAQFARALSEKRPLAGPRPPGRWKGCDRALSPGFFDLGGNFLETFAVGHGEFHIPPREIPDILPQHLLMLKTAALAMDDAGLERRTERLAMGALVGLDFDFEAANFHLRWHLERRFAAWRRERFAHLAPEEAERLLERLKDAVSPPLTASRTLGALGSMAASRIAREFRFGGMSFTVSASEASGVRALEIAVRALAARELDCALVGGVDLCGDLRRVALDRVEADPFPGPADGAAALVLKRLDDALADGDRIYAVVSGIGAGAGFGGRAPGGGMRALQAALAEAGNPPPAPAAWILSGRGSAAPLAAATAWSREAERLEEIVGDLGALAGLAAVLAAALRLRPGKTDPQAPQDAADWALASTLAADGDGLHVVLRRPPAGAEKALPAAEPAAAASDAHPKESVRVAVAGRPIDLPPLPEVPAAAGPPCPEVFDHAGAGVEDAIARLAAVSRATAAAHADFLEASAEMTRAAAEAAAIASRLAAAAPGAVPPAAPPDPAPPPAFTREQCLEFARGSAARVLGPEFAAVDRFPVRVRLPDEPLMLVDRILSVEGEKGRLGPGRIVTEHEVLPGAWYLDGGRAPVCIAVEAGQADLFLCAFLGIDLEVRGRRAYRLLDATVEFHRGLPLPGETIRYDIAIDKFVRQGESRLFLFRFTGSIAGRPLITMTGGCAGFFTPEEVENSGGVLLTEEERAPRSGACPADWSPPVPMRPESYDDRQIAALRTGDLEACFGERFRGLHLPEAQRLPGGRMALIHRVARIDPRGGRYGIGRIEAEADIRPDDWFLTCHFVDDPVMPGTLMYECCAHALRVFLQRMGWVSVSPRARFGPLLGKPATLKCRGPVTPRTPRVTYRIDIKELGFGPEPYAVADADMLTGDRHIVHFTDMSLRLEGTTGEEIAALWSRRPAWDRERLIEFAAGSPSRAFGERYRPFDEGGRFIARLPSPPYLFMDRITAIDAEPWELKAGGSVAAEVDLDPRAWYMAAEGTGAPPGCVLLEAALQPCGWLAAYMGSALKSDKPLHFRNLGGSARFIRRPGPPDGPLAVRARLTQVAEVVDMLIEHFDFEVDDAAGPLYTGSTYFGFFTPAALARQEGLRDAPLWAFRAAGEARGAVDLPDLPPRSPEDPVRPAATGLALPGKALRMIDRIERLDPEGGPHGLGYVLGAKTVDPQEWFFKAHFHADPVWPGSLGIDAFIQLLKFFALTKWPDMITSHRFALAANERHRWTYRGQVLPANRLVRVEAAVTRVEDGPEPAIFGEGHLMADGLVIYRMENFGLRLLLSGGARPASGNS
jgi:3-oxoacyl-(acyl-carrier-protein) synthase/3-hydroxymyristoyl/3-hydroxydecanoyl-(acyl carrier protein) dehydratase